MANLDSDDITHLENAYPLFRETDFPQYVRDIDDRILSFHLPIVGPGRVDGPPGSEPDTQADGALAYLLFDGLAGAKAGYRTIRVSDQFVDTPDIHVNWTKSDDVDRSGEEVRWTVSYKVFDGISQDAALNPTVVNLDGTYTDSGTTTRIVLRTASVALTGVVAGYHIAIKVEKGTPGGSAMAAPGLVSLDFTYRGRVNR